MTRSSVQRFPRPVRRPIAVERARQEVIRANAGEQPNGRDQILRCLDAILPTTSSWDAFLGMAETFAPVNTVALLLEATRGAGGATTAPVVLADAGVENVNVAIGALIETGVLRRLLAFTELRFWNSMIEAWRRSLKHHGCTAARSTARRRSADWCSTFTSTSTCGRIRRFAGRHLTRCNLAPGSGAAVPEELTSRAAVARRARLEADRSSSCTTCPSLNAASRRSLTGFSTRRCARVRAVPTAGAPRTDAVPPSERLRIRIAVQWVPLHLAQFHSAVLAFHR